MKILITENQIRRLQFKYLDYLFDGMSEIKSAKYPGDIRWKKDGKIILELGRTGKFWVLYSIWDNISNMFSLDYDETQQLIKEWVEQHLELEDITPKTNKFRVPVLVEGRLK
jgi:hypothetical protein